MNTEYKIYQTFVININIINKEIHEYSYTEIGRDYKMMLAQIKRI